MNLPAWRRLAFCTLLFVASNATTHGQAPVIVTSPVPQTVTLGDTATLSVSASGATPLSYRWLLDNRVLTNWPGVSGANTATVTLSPVDGWMAGSYKVAVLNAQGSATSAPVVLTVSHAVPLAPALDTDGTSLLWSTGGSVPWSGQDLIAHDGVDAARVSNLPDFGLSILQTTVQGPGTLGFWWKISSEPSADPLLFYLNGIEQARISGEVDWQENVYTLPAGPQTLQWRYIKNGSGTGGQDLAWLDQVRFIPDSPVCSFALSPTSSSHPATVSTGSVNVATADGCFWSVLNSNSWIRVLSATNGTGSTNLLYRVLGNTNSASRSGNVRIGDQNLFVTQAGNGATNSCVFTLSPTSRTHPITLSTGSVEVAASGSNCLWTVWNTNTWIQILEGTNGGVGNGVMVYQVLPNLDRPSRIGLIRIDGRNFVVNQEGTNSSCTFTLSPTSREHPAILSTGEVNVATTSGCSWSTENTNVWIQILSGTNGSGSGSMVYRVLANATAFARTGILRIGSQSFRVTQLGTIATNTCTFTLSPPSRSHPAQMSTGLVEVTTTTNCLWTVANTNTWIQILQGTNGSGRGVVVYRVLPNPLSFTRTGVVRIDGQLFIVTQEGADAPCSLTISPPSRNHPPSPSTGEVSVATSDGCLWTVSNTNFWIQILHGSNSTGSDVVLYRVAANFGSSTRTGLINIGNQSFLVTQSARETNACFVTLAPVTQTHPANLSTGQVEVLTGTNCLWSVVNTNPWIQIVQGTNGGIGNGLVTYRVSPNPLLSTRSGIVRIGGQNFIVNQEGAIASCTFTLSPTARNHPFGSSTGEISVATSDACLWAAVTTNSWIQIISGTNGTGPGRVIYRILRNPGSLSRIGALRVAGQIFLVTQEGVSTEITPLLLPPVVVSNVGHRFVPSFQAGAGALVVDSLIHMDPAETGGGQLPTVSVNWDLHTQFSITVAAPPRHRFEIRLPADRVGRFGGFLWWESTQGGFSPPGTVEVTFSGLEGRAPEFVDAVSVLSDTHGFFGLVDLDSSAISGRLAFTSMTLKATVKPQVGGNGTEIYAPHPASTLEISYPTTAGTDPGRFISIVPFSRPPRIALIESSLRDGANLFVEGEPGRMHVIECSDDLRQWTPIATNVMPALACATCPALLLNDRSGTNLTCRFYRVLELP